MKKTKIQEELELIRARDGLIIPEKVVEFARDPATALHSCFTWDDGEAAHQYRLWQARQVIRVNVVVLPQHDKPVRAYVSLTPDRKGKGGGYRGIAEVLSDEERREILLQDALAELKTFRRKYATLSDLAGIFREIDKLVQPEQPGPSRKFVRVSGKTTRFADQPIAPCL